MDTQRIEHGPSTGLHQISGHLFHGRMNVVSAYPAALQRAIHFICQNYTDPIALSEVASRAFVSSSHLSYLFRQHLALRFKNLLCELRIRHALMMIDENPAALITEISLYSGFFDLSHFEKMFRRYTSMSPREYRAHIRKSQQELIPEPA